MIQIDAYIHEEECRLTAHGHAGFNPGNDIVCAGCSAIITMLAGYLINKFEQNQLLKMELEHGDADIYVKGEAVEIFEMAVIGLMQIEKVYPKNIKVNVSAKTF